MKNILILMALVATFVLVGCPAKQDDPAPSVSKVEAEQAGTQPSEVVDPE